MKNIFILTILIVFIIPQLQAQTATPIDSLKNNNIEINQIKTTIEITILPKKQINKIESLILTNKEDFPDFLLTGFAIYTENKNIIIPVYYSLIAFLSVIVMLNIIFKKSKDSLKEEAEELLKKEEIKQKNITKEKKEELIDKIENKEEQKYKKELESIPEIETESDGKEMEQKIEKEKTEIDEKEVFKESEERLVDEVKKEINEEKKEIKKEKPKGQPTPLNEKEEKEDTEKLIKEAKELENKESP